MTMRRRPPTAVSALDRAEKLLPPGFDAKKELTLCVSVLAAAASVLVLGFLLSYGSAWSDMYTVNNAGRRVEIAGAVFPGFGGMMLPGIIAFAVASAAFLALAYRYVSYHYKGGSRCIYTMRRLPRRREFFIRCCAFPLAGLVACQAVWRLLGLLCALLYMFATPDRWLADGSWAEILHVLTH